MQARTLLAITAVFMLLMVCLNFSLAAYVIYLTLPFAILALLGVGLAIYCGWRMGIWIFIGMNVVLAIYNLVMLCIIIPQRGGPSRHPIDTTWNSLQLAVETLCIGLAIWVLIELQMEDSQKDSR